LLASPFFLAVLLIAAYCGEKAWNSNAGEFPRIKHTAFRTR